MDKSKSVLLCRGLLLVFTLTLIFVFTGCESGKEELLEEGRLQAKENERRIAAGNTFVLGLCDNGTLVRSEGASEAIDEWKDIVEVDAAGWTVAGVCFDGTVVFTTEENGMEDFDTSFWTDVVAVNVSSATIVGLKSDGTVVATGDNNLGQCEVEDWTEIKAVYASTTNTIGVKEDGTVVVVGQNMQGQKEALSKWRDIVDVAVVKDCIAGLKANGEVEYCGYYAQEEVKEPIDVSDWRGVVDIEMGSGFLLGLKSDGTVVATGDNFQGQCNTASWKNTISIKAKWSYSVGLSLDGDIYAKGAIRGVSKGAPVEKIQNPVALAVSERSFFCITEEGKIMGIGTSPSFDSLPELPFLWKQARPFT